MKAVYEMPKVSFEAFMANNAVSACGYKFDCVRHGNKKNYDGYEDHDVQVSDCEPGSTVVANILGMSGCTDYAGFAVLDDQKDNIEGWNFSVAGLDDDLHDDNKHIMKSTYGQGPGLLGWLYITLSGGKYSQTGWETDTENKKNWLDFDDDDLKNGWHAWLTPVFSVKSTSGM